MFQICYYVWGTRYIRIRLPKKQYVDFSWENHYGLDINRKHGYFQIGKLYFEINYGLGECGDNRQQQSEER